jgi:glycosyltransferase involved in cell wall biosynthesis
MIYQAHFPNNPITPGVCLIQAAMELFAVLRGKNFSIKTLKNVKFTAPVSPTEYSEVDFHLAFSDNNLKVEIREKETVFSKMSLEIVEAQCSAIKNKNSTLRFCVIIPVYNAENLIGNVIKSVLQYTANLIVVNDGSTDGTWDVLLAVSKQTPFLLVSYEKNRGKGYALQKGFRQALERGFTHAVTLDSDGQHQPSDIAAMVQKATEIPKALIVGSRKFDNPNMPSGNKFANNFSNFWFTLQTAKKMPDTQTGFRVYPLQEIGLINLFTNRYEAELELLVRAVWRGIPLVSQAVNVFYPPADERVSHFRGGRDFFRISVLNAVLCAAAAVYGYPSLFYRKIFNK